MSKNNQLRLKVYITIGVIAMAAVGFLWWGDHRANTAEASAQSKAKAGDKAKEAVPVELSAARRGEMVSTIGATANLRALREVDVASRTEGVVKEVLVEEGSYVREGQLLCKLDDSQLQIQLQSARQKLAQARLQLEKAQIQQDKSAVQVESVREDLARNEALFQEKLVSERDVAQSRYRLRELEHDARVSSSQSQELTHRVRELEAEEARVSLEIRQTQVSAPFAGCIVQRSVEIGRTVRNLDPLFRLSAFSPLYADVFLSEAEARRVQAGQTATLRLGADESRRTDGRVARISPVVDQGTGTVKVTVELKSGQSEFKPGAFVRVNIQTERRTDAILIPKRAVLEEDGVKYVFVAEKLVARKVKLTLGHENNGDVEVRQGITPGQQVVVAGQGGLKDGSPIRLPQDRKTVPANQAAAKRTGA